MNVPQHVAIILDGNGRWAKAKGMPRNYGHAQGSKNVEKICEEAWRMGIKYLTVYAFSTENWNRPESEVSALMKLLRNYMKTCLKTAAKNDMKVRVLGDIAALDEDIRTRILELEEATKNNGGLNFQIALNYGSRDEMIRAMRRLAKDCVDGKVQPEGIDETVFESYLDTCGIPDPGFADPYQWRTASFELFIVAAGVYRILFYRDSVAGFYKRGIRKGNCAV